MPISLACLNFSSVAGGLGCVWVFLWMVVLILFFFFNVEVILIGKSA